MPQELTIKSERQASRTSVALNVALMNSAVLVPAHNAGKSFHYDE